MNNELEPCPFCGSNPVLEMDESWYWQHHVFCPECGVSTGYFDTAEEAKQVWNRREERRSKRYSV